MRLSAAALLTLALSTPALAQPAYPATDIIKGAVNDFIRPAMASLAADTAALDSSIDALCSAPSAATLGATQAQFRTTAVAFARVEFLRLGPLGVDDRLERLLFWPDPKGIALRQVQGALASEDMSAADPETLRGKSVAMQGFGALEYLLFGTGSDGLATEGSDHFRCSYASAIGTLTNGIAQTVNGEWQDDSAEGPLAHMLDPQPDAQDYRTLTEVLQKLYATLINGSDTIRDQRLAPVLGVAEGRPRPKSALFWRSDMTLPTLQADFAGLRDFFVAAKFPEAVTAAGGKWISDSTLFEFDNAVNVAASLTEPVDTIVGQPEMLQQLKLLYNITGSLDTLVGENLPTALGLPPQFSLLDGD